MSTPPAASRHAASLAALPRLWRRLGATPLRRIDLLPGLLTGLLPGLLLAGALAAVSMRLAAVPALAAHGASALTLAIVLGMLLGNTVYPRLGASCGPGVHFARQRLLRAGIVLYGLRLTLHDVARVGAAGVLLDVLVVASTFLLAWWLGTRVLGLDRRLAMLIGAGSAVCGAAAVMGAEPVVRARAEQVTVAVATVVVFGTLAMFLSPALYAAAGGWFGGARAFGVYTGATVHEVAQVVAAARGISADAADAAVIAKMVRVMLLAPMLLALSLWLGRRGRRDQYDHAGGSAGGDVALPWFAFGFVAMVLLHSLDWLGPGLVSAAIDVDGVLLAMAMAALGLSTHIGSIRQAGARPLWLAAILFVWLLAGGALMHRAVTQLLG